MRLNNSKPLRIEYVRVYDRAIYGNECKDVVVLAVGDKQIMLSDRSRQELCCARLSTIDIVTIAEWQMRYCPFCARELRLVEYVSKH